MPGSVSEDRVKLAVRDLVGRNPLISVKALQDELKKIGFQTPSGNPLDWRYVAKVVRKLDREKALAVDTQKGNERLAQTKEPYRLITDRLWKIVTGEGAMFPPSNDDIVRAANTIVKLDLAILKAEMDAGIFDRKLGTVDVNLYRKIVRARIRRRSSPQRSSTGACSSTSLSSKGRK
jgi:hypothetical protein